MKGYMYILECDDGSFYLGSTVKLEERIVEHNEGKGAEHTRKHLPVNLVYYEEYDNIEQAYYREQQVKGWSRKKKLALITDQSENLPLLSQAYRDLKNKN